MLEIEVDMFFVIIMFVVYVMVMSILVEVRKRLGFEWLRGLFV